MSWFWNRSKRITSNSTQRNYGLRTGEEMKNQMQKTIKWLFVKQQNADKRIATLKLQLQNKFKMGKKWIENMMKWLERKAKVKLIIWIKFTTWCLPFKWTSQEVRLDNYKEILEKAMKSLNYFLNKTRNNKGRKVITMMFSMHHILQNFQSSYN